MRDGVVGDACKAKPKCVIVAWKSADIKVAHK
jgi:hypothetical protein